MTSYTPGEFDGLPSTAADDNKLMTQKRVEWLGMTKFAQAAKHFAADLLPVQIKQMMIHNDRVLDDYLAERDRLAFVRATATLDIS